ncbi:uncharacterized protein TNCV_1933801 [Trichonephila clavipes]|nr:uncharacterized protein TNCV_1933801 [Trichonephila clavipes]
MAFAVLADPTCALQGTNRGSRLAMKEFENDVSSLEKLVLYADEHYLAGKLPLGDHLGKVLRGVEEYPQRNVGPLRFHASELKWTSYHRLWPPEHCTSCAGSVTQNSVGGIVPLTSVPPNPYTVNICPQNKPGFITKHNILPNCDIPH